MNAILQTTPLLEPVDRIQCRDKQARYDTYTGAFLSCNFNQRFDNENKQALDIKKGLAVPISFKDAHFILQDCSERKDLERGRQVKKLILQSGLDSITILSDYLIRLFAHCGSLIESNGNFNNVLEPSIYTWSAIISALANLQQAETALDLFHRILLTDVDHNKIKFVYLAVLKACTELSDLHQGRLMHEHIIQSGLQSDIFVGTTLVDMYAKCGSLASAWEIFYNLPGPNVVSWNSIIAAYAQNEEDHLAIRYYRRMQGHGTKPNKVTYLAVLKACGNIADLEQGRSIHHKIIEGGLQHDVFVGSALVDMYAQCGSLVEASKAFEKLPNRDVIAWSSMIAGYAQHGEGFLAIKCFQAMQHDGITPDKYTFSSILNACGSSGAVKQGKCIHEQVIGSGLELDVFVGSALIDMYAKCGSLEEACKTFDKMPNKNAISWGAMISGYVHHDEGYSALECHDTMQKEDIRPEQVTFLGTLGACSILGIIEQGRRIHEQIIGSRLQSDLFIGNALLDMYAKCGSLKEARRVFDMQPKRDIVSWNTMMAGYSELGHISFAAQCLESMQNRGIQPDEVSFIAILSACCRAGLVDEGRGYFKLMREHHGILPNLFHYNCVVDLLSHGGCLKEAELLLRTINQPNIYGWVSLLTACKRHSNMELGACCFDEITRIDSCFATGGFALMSNFCILQKMSKNDHQLVLRQGKRPRYNKKTSGTKGGRQSNSRKASQATKQFPMGAYNILIGANADGRRRNLLCFGDTGNWKD